MQMGGKGDLLEIKKHKQGKEQNYKEWFLRVDWFTQTKLESWMESLES